MGFKWNFLSAFLPITVIGRVLFVLIICGFGVPIPEDITLVSGGVIAGLYPESVNSHLMLVVSMIGVLCRRFNHVPGLVVFTALEFFVSAQCAN